MEMIDLSNQKDDVDIKKLYAGEALTKKDEFISNYHIKVDGVSSQEASR